jgi:hypothetical protein
MRRVPSACDDTRTRKSGRSQEAWSVQAIGIREDAPSSIANGGCCTCREEARHARASSSMPVRTRGGHAVAAVNLLFVVRHAGLPDAPATIPCKILIYFSAMIVARFAVACNCRLDLSNGSPEGPHPRGARTALAASVENGPGERR